MYWFIVFYIRSKVLCNRDTSYHLWTAVSLSENLDQLDLNHLNPFWPLLPVHSLSSKNISLSSDWSFLLLRWLNSIFFTQISVPICCKPFCTVFSRLLYTIYSDMSIIFTQCLQEYWAWHLALTFKGSQTCFIMTLFAFLPTSTFDSNLLNWAFKYLVSSVNLDIAVYC